MSRKAKEAAAFKQAPYSNMAARKVVLFIGLALSVAALLAVIFGALVMFVPSISIPKIPPTVLYMWLFSAGVIAAFLGAVFTVAGANTSKPIARLSMFFEIMAFIAGAALLVIVWFFKTLIPFEAIDRVANCFMLF